MRPPNITIEKLMELKFECREALPHPPNLSKDDGPEANYSKLTKWYKENLIKGSKREFGSDSAKKNDAIKNDAIKKYLMLVEFWISLNKFKGMHEGRNTKHLEMSVGKKIEDMEKKLKIDKREIPVLPTKAMQDILKSSQGYINLAKNEVEKIKPTKFDYFLNFLKLLISKEKTKKIQKYERGLDVVSVLEKQHTEILKKGQGKKETSLIDNDVIDAFKRTKDSYDRYVPKGDIKEHIADEDLSFSGKIKGYGTKGETLMDDVVKEMELDKGKGNVTEEQPATPQQTNGERPSRPTRPKKE